ncbi:MAG TPA: S41 family peptidase [Vicinamibacterales bacterium]|nr:S41 family peptidase [Vicinamibacterales bacterium]
MLLRRGRRRLAAIALAVAAAGAAAAAQGDWRTLALQSFDETWKTVNDTFYDPTFGGLDWPGVRDEYRPRMTAAASPDAARDVIREMLGRLGQSHFGLLSAGSDRNTLPGDAALAITVRAIADGMLVTRVEAESAAARAGLAAGDLILDVDGDALAGAAATASRRPLVEAWQQANRALHGASGSTARLRVRATDGRVRTVDVVREVASGQPVQLGNLPMLRVHVDAEERSTPQGRRVGVIAFNYWMTGVNAPLANAIDRFRHADGLVIDLRGNPGGLADMMRGVAGHVMNDTDLLGRMKMRTTTLEFRANPRRSTADGRLVDPYAGPVAILVDELSGSTSECFAGGLQSLGRARIFGRQTMGQALPALTKRLPNGDALMYVIGDFVTSTGRRLEGQGVIPDEALPLTVSGVSGGKDPDLDAALRWLDRR